MTTPPDPKTPLPATPPRKGTLLVVDDEDGPRSSVRMIFRDEYEMLMASSGPEAIELAQSHRVDVALLDIRMAGMSGIDVLERLKFVDSGIEVVMMTAFETTDTIRQALRLRACDYINKPFDLATVRAAVGKAMQRRSLESELHSNAEQLQALRQELQTLRMEEQIAHTRGEIYASIIHDINGPLAVISGFVQILSDRLNQSDRLEGEGLVFVKDKLKTITRQTTNCIEISRRYLSFIRRQGTETPSSRLSELFADLGNLLAVHPSRAGHQLVVGTIQPGLGVRMNGTDFIQMILNLAVNGLQCSPQSHCVEVLGQRLDVPLDLEQLRDGPQDRVLNLEGFDNRAPLLRVTVRDTGPGIPLELLPRVLQPYFTTKGPKQGTGLGLSIVQRLVREAKGVLHIHTDPGAGSTFTLYLPAVELGT